MSGVLARTPNRIDLAGGTLDIQPLSQIFPGSLTVNLAVSIESEAEVELADGPTKITSEDLGRTIDLDVPAIARLTVERFWEMRHLRTLQQKGCETGRRARRFACSSQKSYAAAWSQATSLTTSLTIQISVI